MPITQVISSLPDAPTRADPSNFRSRADSFLDAMEYLPTELNAYAAQANSTTSTINASQTAAQSAQTAAESARDLAETYRDQAQTYRDGAALYQSGAQTAAIDAAGAQAAAETAETAAAGYASLAQSTNPDTPIRVNPNAISADFSLAAGYNGLSAGPVQINSGVTVTVTRNSTWTIA